MFNIYLYLLGVNLVFPNASPTIRYVFLRFSQSEGKCYVAFKYWCKSTYHSSYTQTQNRYDILVLS